MGLKILLCIPPDYDHNFPPLGTPALSAFLKKHGFKCAQIDLNMAYRDFLTGHMTGRPALTSAEKKVLLKPAITKYFAENLRGRYYSGLLPGNAGELPDIPYGNNTNSSFHFCERLLSSEHLWRYLEDKSENTFYQFYERAGIVERLRKEPAGILGISIISPTQVVAGLTLGLLIKKALPNIHVTIGGQWVTLYRNEILKKKELFRCFDSAIAFEGEAALAELASSLKLGRDIRRVSNIMLPDTELDPASARKEEDMDLLPCPDFDGLPLKDYNGFDGKASLTFETSRGCYWSKCAYCVDLPLPKPSYRRKDPRLVVDDMQSLKERYGAECLMFGDPGLSPRQMREISELMISEGVKMNLWTMARLDPGFNRKLFDLAYKAGFRQINFGFESANDRVCASLDKGNSRERSERIVKDCAASGIKVDLQTMLGLPGESFEDALDTVDFLVSNKGSISEPTFNTYYLTPLNYIYNDPARYGIEYEPDPKLPFRFFIPFRNLRGMDAAQATAVRNMYITLMTAPVDPQGKDAPSAGEQAEGVVGFGLNGESCELRYKYNKRSDIYTFIEDAKREEAHEPGMQAA